MLDGDVGNQSAALFWTKIIGHGCPSPKKTRNVFLSSHVAFHLWLCLRVIVAIALSQLTQLDFQHNARADAYNGFPHKNATDEPI